MNYNNNTIPELYQPYYLKLQDPVGLLHKVVKLVFCWKKDNLSNIIKKATVYKMNRESIA